MEDLNKHTMKIHNTEYIKLPSELLAELGANVALTKEMAYSHSVCDAGGERQHYCTMYNGKRYITTTDMKEMAQKAHEENKQRVLSSIGNKLVFVGMGVEYTARFEDDVCNHRIRTEITNPEGRRFFIEVCAGRGEGMHITHVVDRDQEDDYSKKAQEYREKINAAGGFWKIGKGHPLYDQYQHYMGQPYYWYKKEEWNGLNAKYTTKNVLKLVNKVFDCHFTEMEVDYYHLRTEDYTSISPKAAQHLNLAQRFLLIVCYALVAVL